MTGNKGRKITREERGGGKAAVSTEQSLLCGGRGKKEMRVRRNG